MSAPTCPTIVFEPLQEADLFACYTLCQNTFGECPAFAEVQETKSMDKLPLIRP